MGDPYRFNINIITYVTIVYELVYNVGLKADLIFGTEIL